jgi:CysZ protein
MATSPPSRNNPISGVGYFFKGLSLITQKGVKRYVILPLLINILLFSVAITVALTELPVLMGWAVGLLPVWLGWLSWLLLPLFIVVVVLVAFFGFAVMGNLIAAPFNGPLAEAVERKLTGEVSASCRDSRGLIKDISSSILSELRKLAYFAIRAIPLLILLLIPVVNLVASVLWLLLMSWMLALEYADFPMANHGLTFRRQREILRNRRFLSLGYGGMLTVALVIPGLNFLLIPAGVAGATAMWVEQLSAVANPGEKSGLRNP